MLNRGQVRRKDENDVFRGNMQYVITCLPFVYRKLVIRIRSFVDLTVSKKNYIGFLNMSLFCTDRNCFRILYAPKSPKYLDNIT